MQKKCLQKTQQKPIKNPEKPCKNPETHRKTQQKPKNQNFKNWVFANPEWCNRFYFDTNLI